MLKRKIIFLFMLTAFVFIVLPAIQYFSTAHPFLIILSVILCLFFLVGFYQFMVKPLINLLKDLKKINAEQPNFVNLSGEGNDAISEIRREINKMVGFFQSQLKDITQKQNVHSEELQNKIMQLQKEILSLQEVPTTSHFSLSQLAHYDNLTTLPNRIFFNEILNKSLSHAKRHNKMLALLYIDVDGFNKLNTERGSSAGDAILKELGNRYNRTLRAEDILAKLEGDEFIILLNDIGKAKFASTVAEKLLKATVIPIRFDNHELAVSACIGISIYPNDGTSLEEIIKHTDLALQKAKKIGPNHYQFYTSEMNTEAHEYIQLEGALRKAIQNNELTLYFQPKLHLKKGTLVGVEALIRWAHPELGVISPAKFIPLAEDTGMIMELGEWALNEACRINKSWQDEGFEHISVAVNISPKQFSHTRIVDIISESLKKSKLDPNYLELEISETTIMHDIDKATNKLAAIKALGVELTIDHFGLGYTSLNHLKNFPINGIKIDRNFVKGIPVQPSDIAITSAIIAMAHNLGLLAIAEGVESAEQVQHLSNQNCDVVQGYFLSHPQPAQKIILQFRKLMDGAII